MRAYKARITNEPSTADGGSVWVEAMVFANDFVGATMEVEKAVEKLAKALKAAGCPEASYTTLEADSMELICEVVGGLGFMSSSSQEDVESDLEVWAKKMARKTRKDIDA